MTRRRTRVAAGFAALVALTGGLVLAGSLAAQADAGLELTTTTVTSSTTPYAIAGTVDAANGSNPIEVRAGTDPAGALVCVATVVGTDWTCTVSLPPGLHELTARQPGATPAEDRADTATVVVAPPPPTYLGDDPVVVLQGQMLSFSGFTTAPDAEVTLTVPGIAGCPPQFFGATGSIWSCDIAVPLATPVGSYGADLFQTSGGVEGAHEAIAVEVQAAPPGDDGLAFIGPSTATAGEAITLTGTKNAEVSEVVVRDGTDPGDPELCVVPATTATTWECAEIGLTAGTHVLGAWQGARFTSFEIVVSAPLQITTPADGSVVPTSGGADILIGGSTTTTDEIIVYLDGELPVCTVPAPALETWSCAPIALDPGSYSLVAQQDGQPDASVFFTVIVGGGGEPVAPLLDCTFTPAGFAVTSPQILDIFQIFRATPTSGGGAGGSGPGGGELASPGFCNGDPGTVFPDGTLFAFDGPIATCTGTGTGCTLTGLAPGLYDVYHQVSDGDDSVPNSSYEPHDYLFTIPETPGIGSAGASGSDVVLTGTATPGDTVRVERPTGELLCTALVPGSGVWECVFPRSTASTARVVDIDAQSGGMSAYSAAVAIPVAVPPVTPVTPAPAPAPPDDPQEWTVEVTGDLLNLRPGDPFGVRITGVAEGWGAEVVMHSTPVSLATATSTGAPLAFDLTVPADIESGAHRIEVAAITPLGTRYYRNFDAQVHGGQEPAADPADEGDDPVDPDPAATGGRGGGAVDRSDPGAPSALTASLAPLQRLVENPAAIAIAGGLALALLVLVALPTELLNSSLSSNTSRLGRVYGAIDAALSRAQDWFIRVTRSRALAAALLLVVVSVIYGFVDPGFGFDLVSLRLVLSLAIAFFLLSFVASRISGLIIHRTWGAAGVVALQPSIILFAAVGVVVARILEFSPGFLVGVAIGLELIQASRRVSARAVLVQFLVVVGLALAAWVVYSLFTPGHDFVGMLLGDTLVAVTAEGLTGALISVFPLQFLDGRELWLESKRLWVAAFLLVAVPFALLVLPTAIEGTEVADYGVWLLVFAVFGALSLAIWLVFARAARREAPTEAERVEA